MTISLLYLQLGLFLKKLLKGDNGPLSKSDFVEATSEYIGKRTSLQATIDVQKAYICNGKMEVILNSVSRSPGHVEILIELIQRQIEVKIFPPNYTSINNCNFSL